jgi:predicted small lipoprotein YifL
MIAAPSRTAVLCARALALALAVLSAAACGPTGPTDTPPRTTPAAASSQPSTAVSATPSGTAKPGASASPIAAPSATLPPIVGATQTPCPGKAGTARRGTVESGQSRNWAGFITSSGSSHVTCIEGIWLQPRVRCPAAGQTSVAVWVGIDGSSAVGGLPDASATLAQTGTVGNCDDGQAHYSAWYEFLPDLRHLVAFQLPVAAGDRIWAQVRNTGKGQFLATVINLTQRVGATKAWTLRLAPLLTAEWVVEDPAASCTGGSCTFVTLARFSTVTLNGAITIGGRRYKLATIPFLYLRTTINRAGRTLASPSSLSSKGFTVTWKAS